MSTPMLKTMSWCLSQQISALLSEQNLSMSMAMIKHIKTQYLFVLVVFSSSSSSSMDRVQHKDGCDWMFKPLSTLNVFILSYIGVNANVNAKDNVKVPVSTYFSFALRNRTCQWQWQWWSYTTLHSPMFLIVFSRSSSSSMDRVQRKDGGGWVFKPLSTTNVFILSYIGVNVNANANANAKDNVMVPVSTDFSFTLKNWACQCQWQW